MDWLKDLIFPKEIKLFQVEEKESCRACAQRHIRVGGWEMVRDRADVPIHLSSAEGETAPHSTPGSTLGWLKMGDLPAPSWLQPATSVCLLQLAGPAAVLSGESYESLVRDLRQEELNHLLGSVCHWQLSLSNKPQWMTCIPRKATPELNCIPHFRIFCEPYRDGRGWAVCTRNIPSPEGFWSLGCDHLSLHILWLLTRSLYKLLKLGSWMNEAWSKPNNILFDPLIAGTLFHLKSLSQQEDCADHLWFPAVSSASSDLSEDPRIINNQLPHWDLRYCLV